MKVGDIRYTDSDEALKLINDEPDEQGRYIWKGIVGGDYRVISADYLNVTPRTPSDITVILDGKGSVWTDRDVVETPIETAHRWNQSYPKSAPHRVAVFSFKEWV